MQVGTGKLQQPISPIKRLESKKKKWFKKKSAIAAPSRRVLVSLASELFSQGDERKKNN